MIQTRGIDSARELCRGLLLIETRLVIGLAGASFPVFILDPPSISSRRPVQFETRDSDQSRRLARLRRGTGIRRRRPVG